MGLASAPQAAGGSAAPRTRILALETAVAGLGALFVTAWFAAASAVPPALLAVGRRGCARRAASGPHLAAALATAGPGDSPAGLAVVYRLPALV